MLNKKVLFLLMPKKFQDFEFSDPYNFLKDFGFTCDIATFGEEMQLVGMLGLTVTASKNIYNMKKSDFFIYDAIVIPGGITSPTYLWDNDKLKEIIKIFHNLKKIIATICWASIVPVQAGLIDGSVATVFPTPDAKKILQEHNVDFVDAPYVSCPYKKVITAQGPQFSKLFAIAIFHLLLNQYYE